MEAKEYDNLRNVERAHWYYRGKRRIVAHWIRKFAGEETPKKLLDCGAGTGRFAKEMDSEFEVHVADDHAESLALLADQFPAERIHRIGPSGVEAHGGSFHVVTALDVLEHIEEDTAAVRGIHELLEPGGIFIVTVPASMALWSDWDVSLHHFRRYSKDSLRRCFDDSWDILHLNYTNSLVFPIVWAIRRMGELPLLRNRKGRRSEDHIPWKPLNRTLEELFVRTGCSRFPFPLGVSLILVARRRQ